jgi:chromate reductase
VTAPVILLICGSVRAGSTNAAVLATVNELIPAPFLGELFEGVGELPMFNPDLDREPLPPQVAALRARIANATALLFSTPEYAGAMPGALKNLLEWTVGGVETSGKPSGWINPSTGPTRAAATYHSLGVVLRYTDAAVIADACIEVPVARHQIAGGRVVDAGVRARLAACLVSLLAAVPRSE